MISISAFKKSISMFGISCLPYPLSAFEGKSDFICQELNEEIFSSKSDKNPTVQLIASGTLTVLGRCHTTHNFLIKKINKVF